MDTTQAAQPTDSAPVTDDAVQQADSATANASPDDGSNAPADPSSEAPRKPPKEEQRTRERISQLLQERYQERQAREAAEARLAEFERKQTQTQQFSQLSAEMPDIARYQSLADYNRDMAMWAAKVGEQNALAKWEERQQQANQQNAQQARAMFAEQQRVVAEDSVIGQKMSDGVKKYADFEQVVANPDLPSIRRTPLFGIVLESDHAVDIAYSLAKNPAEMERLATLSLQNPQRAAREVFKLDQGFSGNGVTSAPPPPPSRNGSAAVNKETRDMSDAEWMKWREGELKARRSR